MPANLGEAKNIKLNLNIFYNDDAKRVIPNLV